MWTDVWEMHAPGKQPPRRPSGHMCSPQQHHMPTCSCSSPLQGILPVTGLGVFHTWLPMISSGESVVQMSSVGQESGSASHLV